MRAATVNGMFCGRLVGISIHAAHAGSDGRAQPHFGDFTISIHAAHAGSDAFWFTSAAAQVISIHAAHAGSDSNNFS